MADAAPVARLRILEGPGAGEVFPVVGRTRIGRSPDSEIRLNHPSVSREHALLEPVEGGVRLTDCGSMAGTKLDDAPLAGGTILAPGALIEAGVFKFVFELDRLEPLDAEPDTAEVQAELPIDRPVALGTDSVAGALYRLGEALLSAADPDIAADRFLSEVLAALPGDSAALVALDPLTGRLDVTARRDRGAAQGEGPPRISRTLVQRCLEERRALLVDDVQGHPALGDQTSVQQHRIRSVMCAPLPGRGKDAKPVGAVCLVSRRFHTGFNEAGLRLLSGLANLAALALAGTARTRKLADENRALRGGPAIGKLITSDARMKQVLASVLRVAPLTTTVLINGETGTGKELVAAIVHENSLRCNGPLVKVNCAAISETVLESELFGHEKGAFTDARARRIGRIESAHGGTLFLDEVGEMSPKVQSKLLRAVEQREFERVGGNETVRVDVRFVAATHRNLAEMAAAGTFREDLFYRLSVMPIRLPALRERLVDIPHLAEHFVKEFAAGAGLPAPRFGENALLRLQAYPWPGNVRELRNVMERLVILHSGRDLSADHVLEALGPMAAGRPSPAPISNEPAAAPPDDDAGANLADARARFEADHVKRVLDQSGGNVTEAARKLGMTREALSRRIHRER